jgi:hypothetical protein
MSYTNPRPQVSTPKDTPSKPAVNTYINKDDVYFAFVDVLGFKNAFDGGKDASLDGKFTKVFMHYFEVIGAAKFMKTENKCYAGQTSDSLYFYTEREDYLFEFLKVFSYLNVYAITKDVFFRGGVAKGGLSFKEDYQFYGDSVISAYRLESEISKNPIVTIDENTNSRLSALANSQEAYNKDYAILICEAKNSGRKYLNPFAYIGGGLQLDLTDDFSCEKINKNAVLKKIRNNMAKFEYDDSNYKKYKFLYDEYCNISSDKVEA